MDNYCPAVLDQPCGCCLRTAFVLNRIGTNGKGGVLPRLFCQRLHRCRRSAAFGQGFCGVLLAQFIDDQADGQPDAQPQIRMFAQD